MIIVLFIFLLIRNVRELTNILEDKFESLDDEELAVLDIDNIVICQRSKPMSFVDAILFVAKRRPRAVSRSPDSDEVEWSSYYPLDAEESDTGSVLCAQFCYCFVVLILHTTKSWRRSYFLVVCDGDEWTARR
jgi:hypothetical protein